MFPADTSQEKKIFDKPTSVTLRESFIDR